MFKSLTKQGTNTGALPTDKNEQARKLPPQAGSASSGSESVAVFGSLAHLFPLSPGGGVLLARRRGHHRFRVIPLREMKEKLTDIGKKASETAISGGNLEDPRKGSVLYSLYK